MPRSIGTSVENTFVNGLISEATALNFPEAAATNAIDCIFLPKGNVTRRLGYDFETGYSTTAVLNAEGAINSYLWQAAAGSGIYNIAVVQNGTVLLFYSVSSNGSLSSGFIAKWDLSGWRVPGSPDPTGIEYQFASGSGYLFVVHPCITPTYFMYNPSSNTVTANAIQVQVRDFDGVNDGLAISTRPTNKVGSQNTSVNYLHLYNLYNQGWAPFSSGGIINLQLPAGSPSSQPTPYYQSDPLRTWLGIRNDEPSNADVWWVLKDSLEYFQPSYASSINRGNTPAPKGYYILNAFAMDRSAASGISGIPVVTTYGIQPSAVAFHAGRVFYAGVNAQGFANQIYFSQIVTTTNTTNTNVPVQFGMCYQLNDPTCESLYSLLPTDGGVIKILDCGYIIKMVSMQSSLIIFASNGVWSISGSQGIGFSANDFTIRKVSAVPCISASSFIDANGIPMWWNTDGIYCVSGADALGQVQITSLTDKKIKTWYIDTIPAANVPYVHGYYDTLTKCCFWLYKQAALSDVASRYIYDSVLVFNTLTQAFYPWSVPTSGPTFAGLVSIIGQGAQQVLQSVTTSTGVLVTDNNSNSVTTVVVQTMQMPSVVKYLTNYGGSFTFSEQKSNTYTDFATALGSNALNYTSSFTSGYRIHGDGVKKFQANYLFVYLDNLLANNQLIVQSAYDYAVNSTTGLIGQRQVINSQVSAQSYTVKRLKLRGQGKSVQFMFQSIPGEPFSIVGWTVFESVNQIP